MPKLSQDPSPGVMRSPALPIRLGIVGCGAIAEMAHIPASQRVEQVRLVALVDSDVRHAEELAARLGIPVAAASLDDLVGAVDAIILATPPHVRCRLAREALERGLHVLCEKPMASTAAECAEMISAARDADRTLAVAHTYRFFPNRDHGRMLVHSRELGRLLEARIEQGDPFSWPSRTVYTLRRGLVPGGVLFNEGVHSIDFLFWWFGEPDNFDYEDDAVGGLESNVRLTLRYQDGGTAYLRLSRTCALSNTIEMRFAHGTLSFPIYDMAKLTLSMDGKDELVTVSRDSWDFVGAVALQLEDFVAAAIGRHPPHVPGEDGLKVVHFIESCYRRAARRPRPARMVPPGITW